MSVRSLTVLHSKIFHHTAHQTDATPRSGLLPPVTSIIRLSLYRAARTSKKERKIPSDHRCMHASVRSYSIVYALYPEAVPAVWADFTDCILGSGSIHNRQEELQHTGRQLEHIQLEHFTPHPVAARRLGLAACRFTWAYIRLANSNLLHSALSSLIEASGLRSPSTEARRRGSRPATGCDPARVAPRTRRR